MSNETMVTVQGWVANAPMVRDVGGTAVINFRVGCTPRHYHKASETWVDRETQWYSVSTWRRLAEHAGQSLRQGDAVIVHGRINHRTYLNKLDREVLSVEIEALTIGHDLTRGASRFLKTPAAGGAAAPPPPPSDSAPFPAGDPGAGGSSVAA